MGKREKGLLNAFKSLFSRSYETLTALENITFKVSAGKLKHTERKEIWENKEQYIHKLLKVKHEKIKTDVRGIPVSCVALSIVDKEGD